MKKHIAIFLPFYQTEDDSLGMSPRGEKRLGERKRKRGQEGKVEE